MGIATQKSDLPLKRLRDLLAMSRSANVHEAAVARMRLNELMRRHGVTEADLVEDAIEAARLAPGLDGNQRIELARIIGRSRNVKPAVARDSKDEQIAFQGVPEAAKDARELFTALTNIVERSCELSGATTESDSFLWRTCYWLGFVKAIEKQINPEHASIPKEALPIMLKRTLAPPVIERAAQAFNLMQLRYGGMGSDMAFEQAERFKQQAHDGGFNLGIQISVPLYKGKR